ncbi:EscF/YscF/HrpA family type III secretion system needle major subunit [Halodesulfovibrio spirochaetisodalis]|uniref:Type III secretion protein n=1 Tax=Halodesulfovibrio spirochaetisodalis TaxID=1560234 RepID=A0A1B7X9B8_9BACT|nr:EscF/YscF/HrpA family type III secretion system needle major subunit [Halodesulfovibrio spirochaetisodalis]OBQ45946.1 hypothetical protein SP90_15120 [Halodesulfovibrio spirochaetisodalis]
MSLDINTMFSQNLGKIEDAGATLQKKMQDTLKQGKINPQKMLALQFEMGQYNNLVQATSTMTKSITDTAKSVIQRTG